MVLGEEDMAQLMADIHEAEGVMDQNYSIYRTDSTRMRLRQAVYAKHGVTQAEMDSSLAWYGYNIDKYTNVYDRVLEILDKRLKGVRAQGSELQRTGVGMEVEGDTAVVWRSYTPFFFSPRFERQIVSAELARDHYWRHGDRYELRYKTLGATNAVNAYMVARYGHDSIASRNSRGSSDGWHTMTLDTDTVREAQSVVMELRYAAPEGAPGVTAIDSVTITRIHRGAQ